MFSTEYNYSESYFAFEAAGELPDEGILTGEKGNFRFQRVNDGFAIYDSTLPGTGFVSWPVSEDIYVPDTINGIPVTEIHQSVRLKTTYPIAVEGGKLKRVYLNIKRSTVEDQIRDQGDVLRALLLFMMRDKEEVNQREKFIEIDIDFCKSDSMVELCEITCEQKCILCIPETKSLKVIAPVTVLKGHAPECIERAVFTGKVYPFVYSGWDVDEPNYMCFEGRKNLKYLDGSFRGDICWSFHNCTQLEQVHLSNGIKEVPAYAFEGCGSLKDLYIPDTVTKIGPYAFADCVELQSIHLPSQITIIPRGMLKNCRSLKKCFLADSIEEIDDEAFRGCTSLRRPWIPRNIKRISETAFDYPV